MSATEVAYVTEKPDTLVVVPEAEEVILIEESYEVVTVTTPGPQGATGVGAKGDKGDQGIQGNPGVPGGGLYYVHEQMTPANPWVIFHNLNAFPNVTVVDSAGDIVEGEIKYDSAFQVTITFSGAFAGRAFLS